MIQHRLRTRGRVKWLASLRKWPNDLFPKNTTREAETTTQQANPHSKDTNTHDLTTTNITNPNTQVRLPDIVLLHCPTCKHAVDGTKNKFDMDKLNQRTWCKACRRQKFVRLWQCHCGIPWHTCTIHKGDPARLRQTKAMTDTTAPVPALVANTYQVGSSSTQAWLRQPTTRTSGNKDIIFTKQDEDRANAMVQARALNNNPGAYQPTPVPTNVL